MDIEMVALIGMAVLTAFGMGLTAYVARAGNQNARVLAALLTPVIENVARYADSRLADLGPALAPVHTMAEAVQGAIDDDTDPLVKLINNPAVVALVRQVVRVALEMTDGAPPQEHIPESAPREATH